MLYFAYGSNMNWVQIRMRCPSAEFHSIAKLADHRLTFTVKSKRRGCGAADVVPERGAEVWGVVYRLDDGDISKMDVFEDYVPGRTQNEYTRQEGLVHPQGVEEPIKVTLYLAEKERNPPLPSAEYMRLIVEGAKHWDLPPYYVKQLEQIKVGPDSVALKSWTIGKS
ncbi:MAG: gamma-glutamylcyclotransferase family protein [Candidatus Binatia bacterium]|jgi:gamma-glutamylcyclotransferase (GGCT)/AIG2-like uncharacterized protein YtfP|nr:gamma-glutamylcyclotransferase family protein [Candidatus Binatia bacterium]